MLLDAVKAPAPHRHSGCLHHMSFGELVKHHGGQWSLLAAAAGRAWTNARWPRRQLLQPRGSNQHLPDSPAAAEAVQKRCRALTGRQSVLRAFAGFWVAAHCTARHCTHPLRNTTCAPRPTLRQALSSTHGRPHCAPLTVTATTAPTRTTPACMTAMHACSPVWRCLQASPRLHLQRVCGPAQRVARHSRGRAGASTSVHSVNAIGAMLAARAHRRRAQVQDRECMWWMRVRAHLCVRGETPHRRRHLRARF
jgi:hypothetical protein